MIITNKNIFRAGLFRLMHVRQVASVIRRLFCRVCNLVNNFEVVVVTSPVPTILFGNCMFARVKSPVPDIMKAASISFCVTKVLNF